MNIHELCVYIYIYVCVCVFWNPGSLSWELMANIWKTISHGLLGQLWALGCRHMSPKFRFHRFMWRTRNGSAPWINFVCFQIPWMDFDVDAQICCFLSKKGASHHPNFLSDFPWNQPTFLGYPHDYGNPYIDSWIMLDTCICFPPKPNPTFPLMWVRQSHLSLMFILLLFPWFPWPKRSG